MDRETVIRGTAVAAIGGALAWSVKFVTLALQQGESWIDRSAFGVGLILIVVGSASLTLRLTRRCSAAVTAIAVVVGAAVTFVLVGVLSIVSNALFGTETALGTEGGVTVLALASLLVGITGLRTSADRRVAA